MRIVIACAALAMTCASAQAQRSLFDQTPADPSAGLSARSAAPAPAAAAPARPAPGPSAQAAPATPAPAAPVAEGEVVAKPKPKPKPRGPQPARAVTVVNGTGAAISSLEITAGNKTVRWTKPIDAQAKAVIKMPPLKGCTVSVLATYAEGPGNPGEVDICKDKTIRLTE